FLWIGADLVYARWSESRVEAWIGQLFSAQADQSVNMTCDSKGIQTVCSFADLLKERTVTGVQCRKYAARFDCDAMFSDSAKLPLQAGVAPSRRAVAYMTLPSGR